MKEEQTKTTLKKNKDGYGYKYTELAEIHNYLEEHNMKYYQTIETNEKNGCDYIMTYRFIDGKWEEEPKRGCKVVDAMLSGIKNPAQEQGSALTYARRYSLLMAFGLATEDDDAQSLNKKMKEEAKATPKQIELLLKIYKDDNLSKLLEINKIQKIEDITMKKASELISKNVKKKEEN